MAKKTGKQSASSIILSSRGVRFEIEELPFPRCAKCKSAISSGFRYKDLLGNNVYVCYSCKNRIKDRAAPHRSIRTVSGGSPGSGKRR